MALTDAALKALKPLERRYSVTDGAVRLGCCSGGWPTRRRQQHPWYPQEEYLVSAGSITKATGQRARNLLHWWGIVMC